MNPDDFALAARYSTIRSLEHLLDIDEGLEMSRENHVFHVGNHARYWAQAMGIEYKGA